MTYTVRPETPDDYPAVRGIHRLAFGGDGEARLVDALRRTPGFKPELSLVALDGGTIVGHILFCPIDIETERGDVATLALGPMAVRPGFQRRGVGSALVRSGLEVCRRTGHTSVVVVGHAEYYPRFGFVPAIPNGICPPFEVPDEAFMVCELVPGALRGVWGRVRYPSAFDDV